MKNYTHQVQVRNIEGYDPQHGNDLYLNNNSSGKIWFKDNNSNNHTLQEIWEKVKNL